MKRNGAAASVIMVAVKATHYDVEKCYGAPRHCRGGLPSTRLVANYVDPGALWNVTESEFNCFTHSIVTLTEGTLFHNWKQVLASSRSYFILSVKTVGQ